MDLQHVLSISPGRSYTLFLVWKKVKRKFVKNFAQYLASSSLCTSGLQGNQDVAKCRNASCEILYWRALPFWLWEVKLGLYLELVHLYACCKNCFSLQGPYKNTKGLAVSSGLAFWSFVVVGFFLVLLCLFVCFGEVFCLFTLCCFFFLSSGTFYFILEETVFALDSTVKWKMKFMLAYSEPRFKALIYVL